MATKNIALNYFQSPVIRFTFGCKYSLVVLECDATIYRPDSIKATGTAKGK